MTLSKTYDPASVEQEVWQTWEAADAFRADPGAPGGPFSMVIPPPNVTAALHLGHALNNTLQDVLVRWRRMCGDNAVWLPGTDHAGIATQTVVEKRVLAEQGKRRTDFERDEFVKLIQAWKDEYEQTITNQLKKMGCSCDWSRQAFTMDAARARAVREAFFQLFKEGLIYRGKRLVNWDPATQTALADDEVEMEEVDGHFWYLKYPLVKPGDDASASSPGSSPEFVTVATTRPETMLGDTAVAVNPSDPERAKYIGRKVRLPIVNRVIPIVGDDYVIPPDPDSDDPMKKYASGFLKVTPAHDPNDYEIGLRHGLAIINVMAPDGSISKDHGWPEEEWQPGSRSDPAMGHDEILENLLGMDRYEAREAIVEWFRKNDLLESVRDYRHTVGHSYRSHVAVEPYLSDQWYVQTSSRPDRPLPPEKDLAQIALRAMAQRDEVKSEAQNSESVIDGQLHFTPDRYARTFQHWHENIRDWCISRQLWWGHRIPVWSKEGEHEAAQSQAACRTADGMTYVCLREDDEQLVAELESQGFVRDPDVLDTWFSSALWPLSTLGWPDETRELETWNPTNVLSTAREIITLWVSRMVMFNCYFRGVLPFRDVFIHAMIQDGEGRKMSKSLGNGVDPLDIIHSHGADAMRYTLVSMTTHTQDVRMPVELDAKTGRNTSPKFDVGRNFANKLWNAGRFAMQHLESAAEIGATAPPADASTYGMADRWIRSRLARTADQVDRALRQYNFATYAQLVYDFFWRDLCDWYLETIKPTVGTATRAGQANRATLAACLDAALRLLHPAMPFITETLFAQLNRVYPKRSIDRIDLPAGDLCIHARWPGIDPSLIDAESEQMFERLQTVVGMIRDVRNANHIPPRQEVELSVRVAPEAMHVVPRGIYLIQPLANVLIRDVGPQVERPEHAAVIVRPWIEVYMHQQFDANAEAQRLEARRAELEKDVAALESRLNNRGYVEKAPAHLVQQTRDELAEKQRELATVADNLTRLSGAT